MEGVSFASTLADPGAETGKTTQYFEMFGHRGIWHDGYKAVAFHAPTTPFDNDVWELYDLANDFNENHDLAAEQPDRLAELQRLWWAEAEANQVLPLDDRFGERFAENAARFHGGRTNYTFWAGMGHVPSDVAPDLRSRSYTITAHVEIPDSTAPRACSSPTATRRAATRCSFATDCSCTTSTSAARTRSSRRIARCRPAAVTRSASG